MDALARVFPDAIVDGELCAKSWGETASTVRSMAPVHGSLVRFYVFDVLRVGLISFLGVPLCHRKQELGKLFARLDEVTPLRLLPWDALDGDPESVAKEFLAQGYEGAMLKAQTSCYFPGLRSNSWLKLKFGKETDAIIEGAVLGERRLCRTLGALLVRDPQGRRFKVGTGFTDAERRRLWELYRASKLVGMTVTLIYQEDRKINGRFPRFVRLREDL